jgi:hypothetical protein
LPPARCKLDWANSGNAALGDGLDRLAATAVDGVRFGFIPRFVYLAQAFSMPGDGERFCRDLGLLLNDRERWSPRLLLPLEIRAQRQAILREAMAFLVAMREHPDPASWPTVFPKVAYDAYQCALARDVDRWNRMSWTSALTLLRCRLVSAELKRQAWPRDCFDPTGATLRRIERDGRLIGAYSVGFDGVDNHGQHSRDECWQLYAPLSRPSAVESAATTP